MSVNDSGSQEQREEMGLKGWIVKIRLDLIMQDITGD